jgi:hypothetical protein
MPGRRAGFAHARRRWARTLEPAGRTSGVPRVTARPQVHGRHTIFKFGRNDSSSGFLVLSAIGDLDLRKPSRRPVNILPNARREVSNGLRCTRTEAVLLEDSSLRAADTSGLRRLSKRLSRPVIAGDPAARRPSVEFAKSRISETV